MATTTRTTRTDTNVLSYSAYALIGAADRALQEARTLIERRETLPEELQTQMEDAVAQLRDVLDRTVNQVGDRARSSADEATETLDELAARGQAILDRLRDDPEFAEASKDVKAARAGWTGAVTSARNNLQSAIQRLKAAVTLTGEAAESVAGATESATGRVAKVRDEVKLSDHTKEELYELASQRDIQGRSGMSKQQLIKALSK